MAEERKRMSVSGIAGMGEAEELSFNNANSNNDPRMTPLTLHDNDEEEDDNMSHNSITAGSRSSRRRNKKRKNKKHISSNDSIGASIKNINPNPYLRKKEIEIDSILSPPLSDESNNNNINLWKLRELALTPGGLVNGKSIDSIWLCVCARVCECVEKRRRERKRDKEKCNAIIMPTNAR